MKPGKPSQKNMIPSWKAPKTEGDSHDREREDNESASNVEAELFRLSGAGWDPLHDNPEGLKTSILTRHFDDSIISSQFRGE